MTMTEDAAAQTSALPEAADSQAQPATEPTKKRRPWIPLLVCVATVGVLWLIVVLAPSASAAGGCGGG